MKLSKLTLSDFDELEIQEQQEESHESPYAEHPNLLVSLESYAIRNDKNELLGLVGLIDLWHNRAMVWSLLDVKAAVNMFVIHKALIKLLKCSNQKRIEMYVDCEFKQGHRWAKMLGFEMEAKCMHSYYPDGRNTALYARVN